MTGVPRGTPIEIKSNFFGVRIALVGFGNVGRALARMILRTGVPFTVTALGTKSHGAVVDPRGVDLVTLLAGTDLPLRSLPPIRELPADVLVEISTLDPETGEPALSYIRDALAAGMHVVTANKGPIARAFHELDALASSHGRLLRFEATVADCLPVFTLRRAALPLADVTQIRGIVSSTNNYILSRCAHGDAFNDALAEAQRLGIAEADPRHDLEGHDAAVKATILGNVLMDADLRPEDVSRTPVDRSTGDRALAAAQDGARVRPVITVRRTTHRVEASFAPERLEAGDPLFAVDGFSMGLVIDTDLAGRVAVQLHDPHVDQVAFAILTDLLEISTAIDASGGGTMPRP
jgi:homoserine dehydrogenase